MTHPRFLLVLPFLLLIRPLSAAPEVEASTTTAPSIASVEPESPEAAAPKEETVVERIHRLRRALRERQADSAEKKPVPLSQGEATMDLSLQDVIEDVVFYNPAVEKARLEWLSSLHTTKAAWGAFEPDLVGGFNRSVLDRDNLTTEIYTSGFSNTFYEDRRDYKLAMEGRFFSGAAYNVGYTLAQIDNSVNASQEYQSFAGVTVSQPLLKGAWFGSPLATLKVARLDRRIAFHGFRAQLMRMVYEAEAAYWSLAFAEEKNGFSEESVEIARKIVADSETRLRIGKMSPLDLLEAQAGLASRLSDQADARQELMDAVNHLKLILSSERIDRASWLRTSTPMYEPGKDVVPPPVTEGFVEEVFHTQPEYTVKRYALDREEAAVQYRKDQGLPEVNLKGSYGYSGVAHSRHDAWERLNDKDRKTWSAGVELRVPLFSGLEERNLLAAETYKKRTALEDLKSTEYEVDSSLRLLRQRISALADRIKNAREVVDFRERLLKSELSRLDAGKSNTRLIFEAEEKLSDARQFELETRVRLREAALQFGMVSGTLLVDKGLEVIDESTPLLGEDVIRPRH